MYEIGLAAGERRLVLLLIPPGKTAPPILSSRIQPIPLGPSTGDLIRTALDVDAN